jgi:Putative prokaryotic signal transducing protein
MASSFGRGLRNRILGSEVSLSDKLVTVATFSTPFEARVAKNRLEAEGIPVFLGDEESVGNLWHLGFALGGVKLQVSDDYIQRAMELLTTPPLEEEIEAESDAGESPADSEAIQAAWTCPQCGNQVTADQGFCTVCGSAGDEADEDTITRPRNDSSEMTEDVPDLPIPSLGDDIAFRAMKAAAFGLLFFPLIFYSSWLLFRLLTFPGELSPQGTRHMLIALVLDFVGLLVVLPFLYFMLR